MWRKQSHNAHFYQVYVFLLHAPCVCQNSISNGSAGNTLYKPVQTISTHFSHLFLCLFFLLLSAWSWVCLSRCLSLHIRLTHELWPLCAHACWREQTLRHMISAGRWKIPFISFSFSCHAPHPPPLLSVLAFLESPVSRRKHFWYFGGQLIKFVGVFSFWFL